METEYYKNRFKLIPAVYLILIDEGNILLQRRKDTGHMDGFYSLPAGHLESKETLAEGICRETKEETNLDLAVDDVQLVHVISKKNCINGERVDFYFKAIVWQGEPQIMEPDKCDDLQWFALDALPENTVSYVKQALEYMQKGIMYSDYNLPE